MRRIALAIAGLLVALGVGLVGWGAFLPRAHRATSEIVIDRPRDEIWSVLRDIGATPRWWPEVTESTRVDAPGGRERWRQVIGGFELVIEVAEDVPPERLVTAVVTSEGTMFGGRWTYRLQPDSAGTRVTLTEDAWIGPWPFRAIARLAGYHATADECLASLSRHFGANGTPRHVEGS
jgi:uncharacterized protein YndB with AHSA1/START domain